MDPFKFQKCVAQRPHCCDVCKIDIDVGEASIRAGSQVFHVNCYVRKLQQLMEKCVLTAKAISNEQ